MKSGQITNPDPLFVDLGLHIGIKYMEIGIELGLPYEVLKDKLETGASVMFQGSRKAMEMLQLWQTSISENYFTYSRLAAALEKHGLKQCAYEYCYTRAKD